MISLNRAQIIGNLTRDPEIKYIPSGQAVTSFSVATNRRWNDKEGSPQEDTQYHEIVAWGKTAEIITQIFKKGNKIFVEGRLQTRSWEAPDGSKRQKTEIVLENFVPLTPKGSGDFAPATNQNNDFLKSSSKDEKPKSDTKKSQEPDDETINLDDIPF